MKAKQIKDYINLCYELDNLNDEIKLLKNSKITEIVKSSEQDYPYTERLVKITGYEKCHLTELKKIQLRKEEVKKMIIDIQKYVSMIPDNKIKRIIKLRYFQGLAWNKIAVILGKDNTENSVRKAAERFLKKI